MSSKKVSSAPRLQIQLARLNGRVCGISTSEQSPKKSICDKPKALSP
jgi:hypothetical protein